MAQFMDAITFTAFATKPILASEVLNMLLIVILFTGVSQLKYTKCHTLPDTNEIIGNAWE